MGARIKSLVAFSPAASYIVKRHLRHRPLHAIAGLVSTMKTDCSRSLRLRRVVASLKSIARSHPDDCVLVVAHGGTLRRVQEAALGEAQPVFENCGVWAVAVEDGEFRPID